MATISELYDQLQPILAAQALTARDVNGAFEALRIARLRSDNIAAAQAALDAAAERNAALTDRINQIGAQINRMAIPLDYEVLFTRSEDGPTGHGW
jgi:hypothetical protein